MSMDWYRFGDLVGVTNHDFSNHLSSQMFC